MNELVFGIDFGTTFSTIAAAQGERTWVVEGAGGERVVPSVVHYDAEGRVTVGDRAHLRGILEPDRTVTGVKRLIGRSFDTPVVQQFMQTTTYHVEPDPQRYCRIRIDDRHFRPGEVATRVFEELRDRARTATGIRVVSAVITAPAHFGASQRRAIQAAAGRAEIDVLRVLTEPTAASVAYAARSRGSEKVLIFDLGGGTFDVTVLRIDDGVHEILAVGGHPLLGGLDFDTAICDDLESQVLVQTGLNIREEPVAHRRLMVKAEEIKRELSEVATVEHLVAQLLGGRDIRLTYSRPALESRIARLVDRAVEISENVLRDSGLHKTEIDRVILVGGSTRVPCVRQRLSERFGDRVVHAVHAQEAVALGAAMYAASLGTDRHLRLLDVLPASVGVVGQQQRMLPLIKHNTPLPCEGSFEIAFDGDDRHQFVIYQGEQEFVGDNEPLGVVDLEVEGQPVDAALVTVRADTEGMVTVSAFDVGSGQVIRTQFNLRIPAAAR